MMPRILIVSDPFCAPAYTPRLRYLCDYLYKKGYDISVYTEQWETLPFLHDYTIVEKPRPYHSTWAWALYAFWSLLTDHRNRSFSNWLVRQIGNQHFDLVFCTTFSTFPLRAAHHIAKRLQVPLVADIRDIDEQFTDNYNYGHQQWWASPFRKFYRKVNLKRRNRILEATDCITTVSPWHVDFLRRFNPNTRLIYNGYDPALFYAEDINTPAFLVSYIGRIYAFQNTKLIEQALQELNLPNVSLNLHTPTHHPIPIAEVGNEIRRSSIILVLVHPQAKGMMTTKFFEALGCEKPILCIPSDEGMLAETIRVTRAGVATSNLEDVKNFILEKYQEWQTNGFTRQKVTDKEQFSREYQARQFEELFLQYIQ